MFMIASRLWLGGNTRVKWSHQTDDEITYVISMR